VANGRFGRGSAARKNLHIVPNGCRKSPLNGIYERCCINYCPKKRTCSSRKHRRSCSDTLRRLEIQARVKELFRGSLAIRVVTAGSSNACEQSSLRWESFL